ncbi:MAG: NADH-quinone oxidoreductase subunit A [Chloroflexi bacterium]|nr:NADH-quinone oxidoreductase subunit A [Chloroflexota bacterium]
MLGQWGHMGFLVAVGLSLPAVALIVSFLLGLVKIRPNMPNAIKQDTYECGVETEGPSWVQFHVGYYVYALLFVIFDIETVFLYPWAVSLRQEKLFGFVDALLFIAILFVGFAYAWRKKAFEWR